MSNVQVRGLALAAMVCAFFNGATHAQSASIDSSYSPVTSGSWSYRALPAGSESVFTDSGGAIRIVIGCTRATRQVSIERVSPAPAATLSIWTSSATRNLASRFDQQRQRVVALTPAYDSIVDAIAFSRGRFSVSMPGAAAIVVPTGPEIDHIVEDCRAA